MDIKKCLLVLSMLALTGCSVGSYSYSREAMKRVDMNFVGIPTILGAGALGTSIPITPEYSLTAGHVARWTMHRVKAYHPYCDLAIIHHKNNLKKLPVFRTTKVGEPVRMYGYSFFSAMPVESSGTNLAMTGIRNGWNKKPCVAMASNAGAVQGMSGGAVYHSDDSIGGVLVGYTSEVKNTATQETKLKNVSLYIPYQVFQTWLEVSTAS
ncbi:serine protease [Erwinia sp. SLM-02]|uniref:serine protease n=1 Tax=Erwinia sp. SLM-02 TaxID=3020057 RepID=UPI00308055BC